MPVTEPIRLVCPECDTVHRVKSVTLGKLYRCKKCKAGLITMSPAIVRCPACEASHPPAHVDVSRLITCGTCAGEPLMQVVFPPPVRPVREVESEPALPKPGSDTADALGAGAGPVTPEKSTPPPESIPGDDADSALAIPGQETRAIQALRQVMDEVQAPLINEIERSRASVPVWAMMLVALPVIALIGFLSYSHIRMRRQTEELAALHQDMKTSKGKVSDLQAELKQIKVLTARYHEDLNKLKPQLKAEQQQAEKFRLYAKKWKDIATEKHQQCEALKQRLRALGFDPDAASASAGANRAE